MPTKIAANAAALRRWLARCEETLGNHSDRLNAINIFPVADGDTGTNLYLTVRAAHQAVAGNQATDLGELLAEAGQSALENARGNSGTLIAVLLCSMAEPLRGAQRLSPQLLASALSRAQIRAWSALSDPLRGTMLSVLEASAEGAATADSALGGDDSNYALSVTLDAVVEAAREAVIRTEDQLDQLRHAHVVDAGGVGLLLVLDCLRSVIVHQETNSELVEGLAGYGNEVGNMHATLEVVDGFELMCTISLSPLDAATLRMRLDELGDSVIMSPMGQPQEPEQSRSSEQQETYRWRVHVHAPAAEPALAAIEALGVPDHVSVTPLRIATHDEPDF
ncbi:DAK2 domain-containing protein [Psychromicrobium xiongbiense]|uniref:DAK2 domain-containing protein n=1 Tax=Psychromicrobium xiongbiense TaxID=3051184 RepID=UPI002555CAD0|nr:DAK2 domain-containing protein [Psychromicrobium sp. YIM S02556]